MPCGERRPRVRELVDVPDGREDCTANRHPGGDANGPATSRGTRVETRRRRMKTHHVRLALERQPTYSIIASPPARLAVSVVVPVKDEAENLVALASEITTAMSASPWSWECVWVDDGSTDGSGLVLERVSSEDPRHRVLSLRRDPGRSAALAAGLSAARGELFVTLDADGQSDPGQVPAMILLLIQSRADLVNGWRERGAGGLLPRMPSWIANGLRRWVTREAVHDVACPLRVLRRDVVQGLFVFQGFHRFLPTLARLNGATRIVEVPVRRRTPLPARTRHGVDDRLWVALADAFAVRWLLGRATSRGPRGSTPDAARLDLPEPRTALSGNPAASPARVRRSPRLLR
jgi:hypothetical protein